MEQRLAVCTQCGAVNRLPAGRPAGEAKCGTCKTPLFAGKPVDVDGRMLQRQVDRGSVPVLADIWAPWCGPCRAMAPAFEAAARELEPDVRLVKLNSDAEQETAARLGIRGIPTMILFRDGRELTRTSGAMPATQIIAWTRASIGKG